MNWASLLPADFHQYDQAVADVMEANMSDLPKSVPSVARPNPVRRWFQDFGDYRLLLVLIAYVLCEQAITALVGLGFFWGTAWLASRNPAWSDLPMLIIHFILPVGLVWRVLLTYVLTRLFLTTLRRIFPVSVVAKVLLTGYPILSVMLTVATFLAMGISVKALFVGSLLQVTVVIPLLGAVLTMAVMALAWWRTLRLLSSHPAAQPTANVSEIVQ